MMRKKERKKKTFLPGRRRKTRFSPRKSYFQVVTISLVSRSQVHYLLLCANQGHDSIRITNEKGKKRHIWFFCLVTSLFLIINSFGENLMTLASIITMLRIAIIIKNSIEFLLGKVRLLK